MPARRPPRKDGSAKLSTTSSYVQLVVLGLAVAVVGIAVAVIVGWQAKTPSMPAAAPSKRGPATALHFAAQKGDAAATEQLLKQGAQVDALTKAGATPLHVASEQGKVDVALELLKFGANVNAKTDLGLTPLSFTAEQGTTEVARHLIASGADVHAPTATGHTPLHIAAQTGHLEVTTLLLDSHADIKARTHLGHTALHLAILMGDSAVAEALISRGAPLDARTESGHSPMHIAAQKGHATIAQLLLSHDAVGALNAVTHMGHTPLMVALDEGQDRLATLLLQSGANASACDSRGMTPLHLAAQRGAAEIIGLLLAKGADANAVSSHGFSPLQVAIYKAPTAGGAPLAGGALSADGVPNADPKIAKLLDPLHTVEALVAGGANLSTAHPWTGQTAAHAAAYLGRDSWLSLMLSQGGAAVAEDARRHVQRGDGLEQRAQSKGRAALSSLLRVARVRAAACDEYEAAIKLAPNRAIAYQRLGAAQARLEHDRGDAATGGAIASYKHAWRLMSGGDDSGADAYATAEVDMALAGLTTDESHPHAKTLVELSCEPRMTTESTADTRRALSLWRREGVVVFPELLDRAALEALREVAERVLDDDGTTAVDRTANIRAKANRTLRALPVADDGAKHALQALTTALGDFLSRALMDPRVLLLELAVMQARRGATAQGWHRDDGVLDRRTASLQIALVDTIADQGALEVQPGTHLESERPDEHTFSVSIAAKAGTVTVYSPNLVHRGRANTLDRARLTVTLTLMGASGLVPYGIPLAVEPTDAGHWWIEGNKLVN